jgi:hypothetical protein
MGDQGGPAVPQNRCTTERRTMKAFRLLLALVFAIVLIAACSKQQKELAGKWQNENGTAVIEFSSGGKLNTSSGPATISTSYKVDKDNILVDLGVFGTGTLKYALSKDTLTITGDKGQAAKYARVKEAKEATVKEKPKAQPEQQAVQKEQPKAQPEQQAVQKEQPKAHPEKQPAQAHAEQPKAQPAAPMNHK